MEKNLIEPLQLDAEVNKLTQELTQSGIDIATWGQGEAKNVRNLAIEILQGEAVVQNGTRIVSVVDASIKYVDNFGRAYELRQEKQVFSDGRIRFRDHLEGISISEKIAWEESPLEALSRGMFEEFGIKNYSLVSQNPIFSEQIQLSQSYPGLISKYNLYFFEVLFSDDVFNPDGYVEVQPDKTTYFIWKEL